MANTKGAVLNIVNIVLILLVWIACIDGFAGVLHTCDVSGEKAEYYYKKGHFQGQDIDFTGDDLHGGRGFVAMLSFVFIFTTISLPLAILRTIGKMPASLEGAKGLNVELVLSTLSSFFMFLAVCVWGGTVYHNAANNDHCHDLKPTGFAYTIVAFLFFSIPAIIVLALIRADPDYQVQSPFGNGSFSGMNEHSGANDGQDAYQGAQSDYAPAASV